MDGAASLPSHCLSAPPRSHPPAVAQGIARRHASPSSPSTAKAPLPHQLPTQKSVRKQLQGAQTCFAQRCPAPGPTHVPKLPPTSEPEAAGALRPSVPPLAGGWFGHSLPAQSRHLPCPVSSPLLPSLHQLPQLCTTPSDGQAGLQACRHPGTARAPSPSPPAGRSLAAAHTRSHEDDSGATAEGHSSTGTIANARSERHTHAHPALLPARRLCSCPGTAGSADVRRADTHRPAPLMPSWPPSWGGMRGCSPSLPREKGLAGDSCC